ncbi:MAG: hypothetical protein KUF74_03810 [Candidatus Thiodiazotropha sp. (ex Ctena orbiculata)]|nr:hypothetical protein [Candidatus Thiodiazotropha taylori]
MRPALFMRYSGVLFLSLLVMVSFSASWLTPFAADAVSCAPFATPDAHHWLGCNDAGQDLWSRLLHGSRISLYTGLSVALLATLLATLVAVFSGYRNG